MLYYFITKTYLIIYYFVSLGSAHERTCLNWEWLCKCTFFLSESCFTSICMFGVTKALTVSFRDMLSYLDLCKTSYNINSLFALKLTNLLTQYPAKIGTFSAGIEQVTCGRHRDISSFSAVNTKNHRLT